MRVGYNQFRMEQELAQEQGKKQRGANLEPWRFQPGQSGNPGGRPRGSKSLKQFAKEYLQSLSDSEKLEYMKAMDKKIIWEMAEGSAKKDVELSGEVQAKIVRLDAGTGIS